MRHSNYVYLSDIIWATFIDCDTMAETTGFSRVSYGNRRRYPMFLGIQSPDDPKFDQGVSCNSRILEDSTQLIPIYT